MCMIMRTSAFHNDIVTFERSRLARYGYRSVSSVCEPSLGCESYSMAMTQNYKLMPEYFFTLEEFYENIDG